MSSDAQAAPVFDAVPTDLDFPRDEATVLAFWKERGIFDKTLRAHTRGTGPSQGTFVFYEGPPTANGMPHNGHVLTRAIKDVVPRYKTMCGYDVPRKAGWDTHGLPVEVEVEKDLGIHGKADIQAYGVEPFIARCIESVFRYTDVWAALTDKIGFWVDTSDAYVTYHKSYVESVWWALSQLHEKGLLYQGHRVCWWWPQGGTALSAAEVGSNYKTVDDPSAYVAFPLQDELEGGPAALCVWTTTPWTLPSNGYAAVRPEYDYVLVDASGRRLQGGGVADRLVVAEGLRETLEKKLGCELPVLARMRGAELVGKRYRPAHDTFAHLRDRTATRKDGSEVPWYWRVLGADFVTLDTGTGIVHVAPAFGEDDHNAHRAELASYLDPDAVELICAVSPAGELTAETGELAGTWVKDADPLLLADLKARGLLVHQETYRHEYPFCWRADDDPLIQLARPAWYIRTTDRIDRAIDNNQRVQWLPEHIKDGRFGDFLANNVDWALSRERFWGTPLNVWVCDGCGKERAPASVADIEALNPAAFQHFHDAKAADPSLNEHLIVHKPWIDRVTFPCAACDGTMRRVTEVIDAWFDSGCMPFAQFGFPHQSGSHDRFERAWPADFISEAVDQTRGWFYSLLMISTLVFDEETTRAQGLTPRDFPHPYKSCVVLGHVCDRGGKKESKSRGNYTPPDIILDRVRLAFAVVAAEGEALAGLKKKPGAEPGVAFIAPEDYDGLDLTGQSAQVRLYRPDRDRDPASAELRPFKGLPRRVIVLSASDREALGVGPAGAGLAIAPSDVPRLPLEEQCFVEDPTRPAPGADAFRWFFYAASPPWTNTRHSLTNVRLLQKDFLIKLRNVYSFFTIYANIDRFDPAAGQGAPVALGHTTPTTPAALVRADGYRPAAERHQLDRWVLSELGLTIAAVRRSMDGYLIYDAALRIVELCDALSNWYVRRSRSRFWASAADPALRQDKWDAYFTLYEALVATCKLIAPFVPFFAEAMYQNLVARPFGQGQPESVHLCHYPAEGDLHVDASLAEQMRRVRELVSLGLQVRTDNNLKVRQPLLRADIVLPHADLVEAMRPYGALIAEELNVHEVGWMLPGQESAEVRYELKPNFRALGPRLGKNVQLVKKLLAEADAGALRAEMAERGTLAVTLEGETVELTEEEVQIHVIAAEGFAAAGGRAGVVVLHAQLTDALLDEGLAREVLSRVQAMRKRRSLAYTATVVLTVYGSERVQRVVKAEQAHIAAEALCSSIEVLGLGGAPEEPSPVQGEPMVLVMR